MRRTEPIRSGANGFRGFTLLEVMMAVLLIGTLMLMLYGRMHKLNTDTQAHSDSVGRGVLFNAAVRRMSSDVRSANSVQFTNGQLQLTLPSGKQPVTWTCVKGTLLRTQHGVIRQFFVDAHSISARSDNDNRRWRITVVRGEGVHKDAKVEFTVAPRVPLPEILP